MAKEYVFVLEPFTQAFQSEVQRFLNMGFELYGNHFVTRTDEEGVEYPFTFSQALVREKPDA